MSIQNFRPLALCRCVYRGGLISNDDIAFLRQNGITDVVDLRSKAERDYIPEASAVGIIEHSFPVRFCASQSGKSIYREIIDGTTVNPAEMITCAYRRMAVEGRQSFVQTFCVVAQSSGNVYVHCKNGKDRTGMFSAMLHLIAGGSYDGALQDYLYSNEVYAEKNRVDFARMSEGFSSLQKDQLKALFELKRDYFDAFFDQVQGICGGVEQYLFDAMDPETKERLHLRF